MKPKPKAITKTRIISESDRNAIQGAIKQSRLVTAARVMARIVRHTDPGPGIIRKRGKLEKDLTAWLLFFGKEAFCNPFSADHKRALKKIEAAIRRGGLFALAMPRGHGKSTILKWTALFVLLSGLRKYMVVVAATAELAQAFVEFIRQQIIESDLLHEFYPHVTEYARKTDGKAIKAKYQLRADGKTSGIQWSKTTIVFPEVMNPKSGKPYISNGAILEAHGLTGAIRGKWRDTKTGKVMRPDFVLLDDPQTRESAESVSQCAMRERIITGDVLGLAGPKKKIAAVMPCTVIQKGDLASRFLDHNVHPEWQGELMQMVTTWPLEQEGLWREYADLFREEVSAGRGIAKATEFYRARRARMDEGSEVNWDSRVRDGEISALQTAENLLLEMGAQFWAEMQNEPQDVDSGQYALTVESVMSHAVGLDPLVLPDTAGIFVGHCDINRSGLHWCLAGFGQDMTGHCPAYGRWPEGHGELWPQNAPELARKQAIYHGLMELCRRLAVMTVQRQGRAVRLGMLLVDRGYEPDVVHKFAAAAVYPFRVLPARGFSAGKYFPRKSYVVGRTMEGCHLSNGDSGQFVAFNADLWRETAQRAFLADPGAPGGFTLFKAAEGYHRRFAEHVTAEKLKNKYETDGGTRWEWAHRPGSEWDWGDALTGCYVAAAMGGLSPSGMPRVVKRYVEKRKARVPVEES